MYIETADDLERKYSGTYVKYKDKVVLVTEFTQLDEEIRIYYKDSGGKSNECVYDHSIIPILFDTHFFNRTIKDQIPGTLHNRLARKQYRRSICSDNSKLTCPILDLYKIYGQSCYNWSSTWNFSDITAMLNPTYPNYFAALEKLPELQVVSISPKFAVCLSNLSTNRYLLCSLFGFIGECDAHTITVEHEAALQEVLDYVAYARVPVRVELNAST